MKIKFFLIFTLALLCVPLFAQQARHIELYTHFLNNNCGGRMSVFVQDFSGDGYNLTSTYFYPDDDTYQFTIQDSWYPGIDVGPNAIWLIINWYPNNGYFADQQIITLTDEQYQTYHLYVAFYRPNLLKSVFMANSGVMIHNHSDSYFYITGKVKVSNPNDGSNPNQWGLRFKLQRPNNTIENFYYHVSSFDEWHNFIIKYCASYSNNNFIFDSGLSILNIFYDYGTSNRPEILVQNVKLYFEYVPNLDAQIISYNTNGDEYHPKISWDISNFPTYWQTDFDVQIWRQLIPIVGSQSDWELVATKSLTDTYYIDYSLLSPSGQGGLFAQEGTAYYKIKLKHKTTALNYDVCSYYQNDEEWNNSFVFSNQVDIIYGSESSNGTPSIKSFKKGITNIIVSGTTIAFSINDNKVLPTKVEIYNLKGQKIRTISTIPLNNGRYRFTWDGLNNQRKTLSNGVYFYKISRGKYKYIKKTFLLK